MYCCLYNNHFLVSVIAADSEGTDHDVESSRFKVLSSNRPLGFSPPDKKAETLNKVLKSLAAPFASVAEDVNLEVFPRGLYFPT